MRQHLAWLAALAGAFTSAFINVHAAPAPQPTVSLTALPVAFEANHGQHDAAVRYLARVRGMQVALRDDGVAFAAAPNAQALRMRFVNARRDARPEGESPTAHKSNYFFGGGAAEAPKHAFSDVPNYERVAYRSLYPGIDAVFYGNRGDVEYDLVLAPGADPNRIAVVFTGAGKLELDAQGDLLVHTAAGVVRQHKPTVYQEVGGRREVVPSRYRLDKGNTVRFEVAAYDKARPLTVDPVLSYSSFLGGTGTDYGYAIAVDAAGNAYVTGQTFSTNFPVAGAYQGTQAGSGDVFVAKLNPQGTALVYSTYIGGRRSTSEGRAIAVDASGSAYVTGVTSAGAFPVTAGAYSAALSGGGAFVTKLSPAGNALTYSTYLAGMSPAAIKVDAGGNAYVAGQSAGGLPTTAGAFQTFLPFAGSGALAKLNAAGSALAYATYVGANSGASAVNGLALDAAGQAHVIGTTSATNFPTTTGAFQTFWTGGSDAFVVKFNAAGTAPVFSSLLGGATDDHGAAIAVDAAGRVYAAGHTESTNFPRVNGFYKALGQYDFVTDAFVTIFNPDGASLLMSTYLGGRACLTTGVSNCSPDQPNDGATAIAVDPSGNHIYVAGFLSSVDVGWLRDAVQPARSGNRDAFLAKIETEPFSGRILDIRWATRLGGDDAEQASGMGVDAQGSAYIVGSTLATTFPTTQGSLRVAAGGGGDAFVAKVALQGSPIVLEGDCVGRLRASLLLDATGTVTFKDNGAAVGTVPISNGRAIVQVPAVAGTHVYTATRDADGAASTPVYCAVEQ